MAFAAVFALAACTAGGTLMPSASTTSTPPTSSRTTQPAAPSPTPSTAPPSPPPTASTAEQLALAAYARMTPAERVGQLFMLGVRSDGARRSEIGDLKRDRAGNVFLLTRSDEGTAAVAAATARTRAVVTVKGVLPFIGVDQEGGQIQRLQGPGFSDMPTALGQGGSSPSWLQSAAAGWGEQLHDAGVNLDLAPVADVVPASVGVKNQPIGRYLREYGSTPASAASSVVAFITGMARSGIATTLKHFPGIGRATGNSDFAARSTDPTRRGDPYLQPFTAGIAAGAPFVMVSSTVYPHISPALACFSRAVIGTMLRGDAGFAGIVISDSFDAAALAKVPERDRAVRFLDAGGTMVLDASTDELHGMAAGVLARARTDAAFAAKVKAAVLLVLETKARLGLVAAS